MCFVVLSRGFLLPSRGVTTAPPTGVRGAIELPAACFHRPPRCSPSCWRDQQTKTTLPWWALRTCSVSSCKLFYMACEAFCVVGGGGLFANIFLRVFSFFFSYFSCFSCLSPFSLVSLLTFLRRICSVSTCELSYTGI